MNKKTKQSSRARMATRIGKSRTAQVPAITSRPDPKTHLFLNFSNRALRRRDAAKARLRSKRVLSAEDALFLEGATKVDLSGASDG